MTTWAVLATGPSMSQAVADAVKVFPCIAVSDAYKLAPWAQAIVSCDSRWWRHHPQAAKLPGRKVSASMDFEALPDGVERLREANGENSGLFGCKVAVQMGATRLLLLGFDMGGSHFFGPHPAPLRNTTPDRFEIFKRQFSGYRPKSIEILNCTPGSALTCYPSSTLEKELARSMQSS